MKITRIKITGLYGKNFDIPIRDNKIVLIGVNGTCKTAILKLVSSAVSNNFQSKNHVFKHMIITADDKDCHFYSIDGFVRGDKIPLSFDVEVLYFTNNFYVNLTKAKNAAYFFGLNDFKSQKTIEILNEYFSDNYKVLDASNLMIDPEKFSDGEIKLLKLFFHISEIGKKHMIFFDDVETNLSVRWQKKFLSDIWNTGKCSFLIAVTHSPFVFENELDDYAIEINSLCRVSE